MSERCHALETFLRQLPLESFWEHVGDLEAMRDVEPCVVEGLASAWRSHDLPLVERYVLAASVRPSDALAPLLVQILVARPREIQLEDVVEVLELVKAPQTVPVLVEALGWTFPWDDQKEFARKCLWALAAISTPEAVAAIEHVATGASDPLRGYARDVLAHGNR